MTRFRKWMLSLRKFTYNEPILTIDADGGRRWRLPNGKLHRAGSPAVEFSNGTKLWYKHGKSHRVDGPAVVFEEGTIYWYLDGNAYYFDDWLEANTYISEEEKVMLKLQYG
jgi:hypothetical protein